MDRDEFIKKYTDYSGNGCGSLEKNGKLCHVYEIGGVCGGSCWGDSDPRPYIADDIDSDFTILDDLLYKCCPNLSFLGYKKIEKLVRIDTYTDYEYYGNRTDYKIKYINLGELYDLLTEMGYGL